MTDYRAAMQELFEVLLEVHPRLDLRTPMPLLLEERRRCVAGSDACQSHAQLARLAGRFLHLVGDGHSRLDLAPTTEVLAPVAVSLIEGPPWRTSCAGRDVVLERALGMPL